MKPIVCAVALVLAATSAQAQGQGLPNSKATAAVNTLVRCNMSTEVVDDASAIVPASCVDLHTGAVVATQGQWVEIMSRPVKLSASQSLFVSPSLVTGLYTRTRTRNNADSTSTAQAIGAVYVRAVLTPAAGGPDIVAAPLNLCTASVFGCTQQSGSWGVIFDSRIQSLTRNISECTVLVDGVEGTCDFTSVIDFVLQTASANTFNFVFPGVGQGTYTLKIYAAVGSSASVVGSGTAVGAAAFGLGTVTAETVRLVHGFEF